MLNVKTIGMLLMLLGNCPQPVLEEGAQGFAFPGAEGFGRHATGGRGGRVYIVTNLNDDGPGSLREAIKQRETRTIVFEVSGTIELKSPLDLQYGNVTLAGQSAPGDGICVKNYPVSIKADNVIIRFLRFRLGDETKQEADAISATNGNRNIIIDHCSISWATDECASFYRNKDFTLQWCIVSESLNQSVHTKGEHGYGGIWGGEGATFHHNLLAHHNSRLPRFSGSETTPNSKDELVDFRNNVIYNWMNNNTYGGETGNYNIINNYYKPGPATRKNNRSTFLDPWKPYGKYFVSGNMLEGTEDVNADNRRGIKNDAALVVTPAAFPVEPVMTHAAGQAFQLVLEKAGASLRRDVVDNRILSEVKSGTATYGNEKNGIIDSQADVGGWPFLKSDTAQPDADRDGMPDAWERAKGLKPDQPDATAKQLHPFYTNLEVYLNSIVEEIMTNN